MKRSRINPISKRDDRTMERKLDALWQNKVLIRAKGRCECCYKLATVGHHVVGRDNKMTRHMLNNGIALCHGCHDWAHRESRIFLDALKYTAPSRYFVYGMRHALLTVPYHVWMEERMKELKP